jgi:hypothetical protein
MTAGFYKLEGAVVLYSPTVTVGPGYMLVADERHEYTEPIDGWWWYNSEEEARAALGLPAPAPLTPSTSP